VISLNADILHTKINVIKFGVILPQSTIAKSERCE